MNRTFTQKYFLLLVFILVEALSLLPNKDALAQCSNSTPVFKVNLDGKPSGSWTSPSTNRDGLCCNVTGPQNCAQFDVVLDSRSGGLQFDIISGPVPSGSMFYQVDCGPMVPVGSPICVTGSGVHELTICMPGNASNTFKITSIAAFNSVPDLKVTQGCFATLSAPIAFNESTVTWNDITGGGTYNSYLSCTSGCSNPTITPGANAPAFVDYVVCGTSNASLCATLPYCDTVRVFFYPPPQIAINPSPAIICPGGTGVELTANVTGGSGTFQYVWTNSSGTVVGNNQKYTATSIGTYSVEVRTENYPNCIKFSNSVTVYSNLTANAGPDQMVCSLNPVQLAGSITAATGGIWNGGGGTFSPNNTTLNARYTPTTAEIQAGFVKLTLTSTGNGNCTAVKDEVVINLYSVSVNLSGTPVICEGNNGTVTATVTGAQGTPTYLWNTGETTATIANKPAGTYTVNISDANGCAVSRSFTITAIPGPTDFNASTQSATCGNNNGTLTITGVTNGTAPYTYSQDGTTFQSNSNFTGLPAGSYTITVKDANGCTLAKSIVIANLDRPSAVSVTANPATCINNGIIAVGTVTGGTAPFTYSINGTSFQTGTTFNNLATGNYTVTVKDANGCTVSAAIAVGSNVPTAFTSSAVASTCGRNNGSLTITGVTGGTAPYTYSKDGTNYQSSATFTNLLAGTYSIIVKDANGCTITNSVVVTNVGGVTDFTATTQASTCANSNGQITISSLIGGAAPFTYSKDGVSFQSSNLFTGLSAGDYQIYVKDANGCVYSEEVLLNDTSGPSFTLVSQASTCSSNNGQISINTITGGVGPYTYSKDGITFQSATLFTGFVAGTYTIMAKDANGCMASRSITVTDIASPAEFTASVSASTCGSSNGSLTISSVSGGVAPYTYSKDGVTFQASATFGSFAAGNYSITVKDANGCTFTKQVTVTNLNGPTDITATSQSATCGSNNGTLTIGPVTGGMAAYTYSKDGVNFQNSSQFNGLLAGTYSITVKDANGCTFTKSVSVPNIAGPGAVSATSVPATCADNDGSITVEPVSGGTAPYTYSVDGTTFQSGLTFSALASGTYMVSAKDANGCIVTQGITVTQNVPTAFTSSTISSTCGSSNGNFTITGVTGGTGPYIYSLNGGSFQTGNSFSNLLAGSYSITVKDAKGCNFTDSLTINNIAGPTDLTATVQASTCNNNNGQIAITGITGGTAPYTFSKNGVTFQASSTFSGLPADAYLIYIKDANGCIYSEEVIINDIAAPTFAAAATASTCGSSNGVISVNSVTGGVAPYSYSKDGISYQTSNTFLNLVEGTYSIRVKDVNGCFTAKAVVVTNIPGPTDFTATASSSTCGNANGSISVSNIVGGTAPYTYSKDGSTFQSSATFNGLPVGSYTITVKDANGCTSIKTITIQNIAGPTAFATNTNASTCGSNNGSLTVGTVTGGTAPYTYSKDGTTFQAAASFSNLQAGSYNITVKDANGCTFSKTVGVNDVGGAIAINTSTTPSACTSNTGSITVNNVTNGVSPYTYSLDGVTYQNASTFDALAPVSHTVYIKDANGCRSSFAVTIQTLGPQALAITATASTCANSNGSLMVNSVTGGTSPYTFSLDGTTYQASAAFTGLPASNYALAVKDANGCTYTQSITVSNLPGPADLVATIKSASCNNSDGAITVSSVAGGTAPYTYSIDGITYQSATTFSGLPSGGYEIYIKDANSCVYSEEVLLNDIPAPIFTAQAQPATCGNSNGVIQISSVSSGVGPYTFSKDGVNYQATAVFNNLATGNYTITVKDSNGCLTAKSVALINVEGPSGVTATVTSTTCGSSNGSVTLSEVTGGTAPYNYSKDGITFQASATFTNLIAGNYTFTVKDANGCTVTKAVTIIDIAGPADLAASSIASTCGGNDGSLTVGAITGGTGPYIYSKDGINFQASSTFANLSSGEYFISVKDANGCVFGKSFTVGNVNGPTSVTFTTSPATCSDNDGSINLKTTTGGTGPYSYSINGTNFQSGLEFTNIASGNYTLSTKDANGCILTQSITVTKNVPTAFTSSTVSSTCGNSNGGLTITGVTGGTGPYTYSLNGSSFQATASFSNLLASSYSITVKDANGCPFTNQVVISNSGGATGLIANVKTTTCGKADGEIAIAGITGGNAPYTYSFNGGAYQSITNFTNLAAGDYKIGVKDANGCVFEKLIQINNIPGPSFTATGKGATCGNSNGQIVISDLSGGTAPYTYSKDGITFQAATSFINLEAGTYTIRTKDANGCFASQTVVIENTVGPSNFASTVSESTCNERNGRILVGTITGGTAPYSYSINNGAFQSSSDFIGLSAGGYTVVVKDANDCTFLKQVIVNNSGGATAVNSTVVPASCVAPDGVITINGVTGGSAPYQYSLDGLTYQTGTQFTNLAPGNYSVWVKDAINCQRSFATVVPGKGPQSAEITVVGAACGQNNGSLTVKTVSGGTGNLTYSHNGVTFQASNTFTGLAAGNYAIYIKDAEGCMLVVSKNIDNTSGADNFVLTATNASCGTNNGSLVIGNISGGQSPYTFSINGQHYQTATSFSGLTVGTYQVYVKDAAGCIKVQTASIKNIPPISKVDFTVIPAGCNQNKGQVLIVQVTGGEAPYVYSLDGTNFFDAPTLATSGRVNAGTYTLTVKDSRNCTFTVNVTVGQVSSTVASIKAITCNNGNDGAIRMTATSPAGTIEYTINNGVTYQANPEFTNLTKGIYTIITRFAADCSITTSNIEVKEPEAIVATVNTTTKAVGGLANGSAVIEAIKGGSWPYTYKLDNGSFAADTTFKNIAPGAHVVQVKDKNGCIISVSFQMENSNEVEIPNGFTPNGDGMNDTWVLANIQLLYPNCKVSVFNRWGNIVFQSVGYKQPWNGTYKGQRLPDGTYYCIIELNNTEPVIRKSVTIMR